MPFRLKAIALAAEIEQMFLQVRTPEVDRNTLRPLWWPNHDLPQSPIDYRITVHPFGAVISLLHKLCTTQNYVGVR